VNEYIIPLGKQGRQYLNSKRMVWRFTLGQHIAERNGLEIERLCLGPALLRHHL
jgi:hypothetical protein